MTRSVVQVHITPPSYTWGAGCPPNSALHHWTGLFLWKEKVPTKKKLVLNQSQAHVLTLILFMTRFTRRKYSLAQFYLWMEWKAHMSWLCFGFMMEYKENIALTVFYFWNLLKREKDGCKPPFCVWLDYGLFSVFCGEMNDFGSKSSQCYFVLKFLTADNDAVVK